MSIINTVHVWGGRERASRPNPTNQSRCVIYSTPSDYYNYVNMLATIAIEAVNDGEASDIGEAITEGVDGTEYTIYNKQARLCVFEFSSNGQVALDHVGWDGLTSGNSSIHEVICRMAYYAVVADVTEAVLDLEEKHEALEEERAAEAAWEDQQDRRCWVASR